MGRYTQLSYIDTADKMTKNRNTQETIIPPDAPPSYDDTIKTAGGWCPPATSTGAYPAPPPTQVVRVVQVPAIDLGCHPVKMVCSNCQMSVTTQTTSSPSMMAWGLSGILCLTMLWPCFCIPLCVDSLKKVKHKCPNCKIVLGSTTAEKLKDCFVRISTRDLGFVF